MLNVFVVHFVEGANTEELLSAEAKSETHAQVMTVAEAKAMGFGGLPNLGPNVRLIAVNRRDAAWISKILEGSNDVAAFNVHDVDI